MSRRSSRRPSSPRRKPTLRRGRPGFEPLEGRQLLATDLAQITGTVSIDLENDLSGDSLAAGQQVELFRDDGANAGVLDAGDTSLGTAMTDAMGNYVFNNVEAGSYLVRVNPTAGFQAGGTGDVTGPIGVTAVQAAGTVAQTIDDFSTAQSITADSSGTNPDSDPDGTNANFAGDRDLFAEITSGNGDAILTSDVFGTGRLRLATAGAPGIARVVWDGVDNDATTIDFDGLSLDLLDGGNNTAITLAAATDRPNNDIVLRLYSSMDNISEAVIPIVDTSDAIIDGDAGEEISIELSSFAQAADALAPADLANIGAIELLIDFTAAGQENLDATFDPIQIVRRTPVPANPILLTPEMSIGDRVFLDVNDNGVFDPGESGIENVAVTLFPDLNNDGSVAGEIAFGGPVLTDADGLYRFDSLQPGNYLVRVDASNFTGGGPLEALVSSSGVATDPDVDPTNSLDRGTPQGDGSVLSQTVTLVGDDEPTTDGDADANTNLTLDFGFFGYDLTVTKNVDQMTAMPGDTVQYTVTVANDGPGDATNVQLVDTLPDGLTFVPAGSDAPDAGPTVVGQTTQLTYNIGPLADGASRTFTINALVDTDAPVSLDNAAVVTGDNETGPPDNNTNTAQTTITRVGEIRGRVFASVDGDTTFGAGDSGLFGVVLTLFDTTNQVVQTTTTGPDGTYVFSNLQPGTYRVVQTQPDLFRTIGETSATPGADAASTSNEIDDVTVDFNVNNGLAPGNDFAEEFGKRRFFWTSLFGLPPT